MTFGERLKQRREFLNMTREDVAALSGVHYAQVGRYETDTSQATAGAIVALANALQVSCDWLLGIPEIYEIESLTKAEHEALILLRLQQPERQKAIVNILKMI